MYTSIDISDIHSFKWKMYTDLDLFEQVSQFDILYDDDNHDSHENQPEKMLDLEVGKKEETILNMEKNRNSEIEWEGNTLILQFKFK